MSRFAISLLSKMRKSEALNDEVLIDKETGEVLFRDNNGKFISYDKFNRINQHINDVTLLAQSMNLIGDIYSVEHGGLTLPASVTENTNLLSSDETLSVDMVNSILLSLDLDCIVFDVDEAMLKINDPIVEVTIQFAHNVTLDSYYNITREFGLTSNNSNVIIPEYPIYDPLDTVDYSVKITNIKVTRSVSDDPLEDMKFILHSLLVLIV